MKYQELTGMYLPDKDNHFDAFIRDGAYQKNHRDLAISFCTDFRVAIDIGAHVGFWACDLECIFDAVHAFEPIPENYDCLEINTNLAHIYRQALGDGSVSQAHFRQIKSGNSGTWARDGEGSKMSFICSLDDYKFDDVNLIKIDVEGDELRVLKGAAETIERCRPVICVELRDEKTMRQAGFPFKDSIEDTKKFLAEMRLVQVGCTVVDHVFVAKENVSD